MLNKIKWAVFLILWAGAASSFAGPKIQHWQTANGANVYFVSAPQLPMVDISIIFDAGSARDQIPGVALLTNGLLMEGTAKMNADQIAEHFEGLGAILGNSSLRDMSTVSLRSLSDGQTLNAALDVLADILHKPSFPKQAFERERNRLLIAVKARKQNPSSVAEEAFYSALYGSHPYRIMPAGTEQSIAKLTRTALQEHHQRYYVARNTVIAIVGALDRQAAQALAKRLVGALPAGQKAAQLAKVEELASSQRKTIQHPSSQTHILVGQPGLSRNDADYFPLYIGNHILGGSGLVSRISDEIREKRGLAYSSYSIFIPMRRRGPFQMGLQTRNDQSEQALQVLLGTLKEFIEKGPSEQELLAAKKNLSGGFALRLDSNKKIANYLAVIGFYDMSLDYLNTFVKKVNAVTLQQITAAFKRRIHPEKMITIIVGGGVAKASR